MKICYNCKLHVFKVQMRLAEFLGSSWNHHRVISLPRELKLGISWRTLFLFLPIMSCCVPILNVGSKVVYTWAKREQLQNCLKPFENIRSSNKTMWYDKYNQGVILLDITKGHYHDICHIMQWTMRIGMYHVEIKDYEKTGNIAIFWCTRCQTQPLSCPSC